MTLYEGDHSYYFRGILTKECTKHIDILKSIKNIFIRSKEKYYKYHIQT